MKEEIASYRELIIAMAEVLEIVCSITFGQATNALPGESQEFILRKMENLAAMIKKFDEET